MTSIYPFKATLANKCSLPEDVFLLTFQTVNFESQFAPGQYVILDVPYSPNPVKRLYSIASSNTSTTHFDLLIKNVVGGIASTYINSLALGQTVSLTGPAGLFSYQKTTKPKVFMTTGTGFAPIRSILLSLTKTDEAKKTLLWGLPTFKSVYLFEELLSLEKELSHFSFLYCLSQEQALSEIPAQFQKYFRIGRISTISEEGLSTKTEDNEYYFCGSRGVVESLRLLLLSKNVNPTQLHFEKY